MLNKYRPISNLPYIGIFFDKAALIQLSNYLNVNDLLDSLQSGFRQHHSTKTALMLNDISLNTDSGKTSVLVLLDLSVAYGTVDHKILLDRLEKWMGHWNKWVVWHSPQWVQISRRQML